MASLSNILSGSDNAYVSYKNGVKEKTDKFFDDFGFFAFSNDQLDAGLDKLGATVSDICKVGMGAFVLKSKVDDMREMLDSRQAEIHRLMKDGDFAYQAFAYEMANHEYQINWDGNWNVFDSIFGGVEYDSVAESDPIVYMSLLGLEVETVNAFYKAKSDYWNHCIENDWF